MAVGGHQSVLTTPGQRVDNRRRPSLLHAVRTTARISFPPTADFTLRRSNRLQHRGLVAAYIHYIGQPTARPARSRTVNRRGRLDLNHENCMQVPTSPPSQHPRPFDNRLSWDEHQPIIDLQRKSVQETPQCFLSSIACYATSTRFPFTVHFVYDHEGLVEKIACQVCTS